MSELNGKRWEDPEDDSTPRGDSRHDPLGESSDEIAHLESQIRIHDENAATMVEEPLPPPPPRPYPFWGWVDALILAGLIGFGILTSSIFVAVVGIVLSAVFGAEQEGPVGGMSLAQAAVAIQLLGFGTALAGLTALFRLRYQTGLFQALHLKRVSRPYLFLIYGLAGLATSLLVALLGAALRLQEMDMPMNEFIKSNADLILIGIAAVTFGPLFEELIFRGFLQPLFMRVLGVAGGILATSLLFALPHGPQYGWHWQHLLIIVVAGSVFGVIRWRTGSTTASTIAHAAYNGFLVAATIVQRSMGMV